MLSPLAGMAITVLSTPALFFNVTAQGSGEAGRLDYRWSVLSVIMGSLAATYLFGFNF